MSTLHDNPYLESRRQQDAKRLQNIRKAEELQEYFLSRDLWAGNCHTPDLDVTSRPIFPSPHKTSAVPESPDRSITPVSLSASGLEVSDTAGASLKRQSINMEQFMINLRSAFEAEVQGLEDKVTDLSKKLKASERLGKKLEDELNESMQRNAALEAELERLKKAGKEQSQASSNEEKEQKQAIQRKLQEQLDQTLRNQTTIEEMAQLRCELKAQETATIRAQSKLAEAEDEMEHDAKKLANMEHDYKDMQNRLERSDKLRYDLQAEVEQAQFELRSYRMSSETYRYQVTDLEKELEACQSVIDGYSESPDLVALLQRSEQHQVDMRIALEDREKNLAMCKVKLDMLVCAISTGSCSIEDKTNLLTRATSENEGLPLVLNGSSDQIRNRDRRTAVAKPKYRDMLEVKASSPARGKWVSEPLSMSQGSLSEPTHLVATP